MSGSRRRTRYVALLGVALVAGLLSGCPKRGAGETASGVALGAHDPGSSASPNSGTAPDDAVHGGEDRLPAVSGLQAGSGYAQARATLARESWLPLQDGSGCRSRLGAREQWCSDSPELFSCDDQTHTCALRFGQVATESVLTLTVALQAGATRFGAVRSWQVAKAAAGPTPGTCPAADFDRFLKAFAGSRQVYDAYTAPILRVARMDEEGEAGYVERQVLVAADDYRDFFLAYRDGGFRIIDSAGQVSASRVKPIIESKPGGAYLVTLPDDVEGMSYLFEPDRGCWRLTADPIAVP